MQNYLLLESFLEDLKQSQTHVSVYLINGIKLSGVVSAHDLSGIILQDTKKTTSQFVYSHAISTLVPAKDL